jgi:polyisoprenyl-phosphate glycosyltransferase
MISVVIPIYNEQENLPELLRRTTAALESLAGRPSWEILFIDDGSTDASAAAIREAHARDPRIKLIALSRNFGHQPALTAGIHHAKGQAVILLDGDLQDPPELIPDLVAKWTHGFQVVLAKRRTRADHGPRGLGFRLFYPLLRRISDLPDAPDAGIFGLMDRAVVDCFNKLPERNRFIPGLRLWLGFKQTAVEYDRQERAQGQPKQTLGRLINYALDGMLSFSTKPLRAATWLGFACAAIGFGTALFFIVRRLFFNDPAVTGFTTLLTMMMFIGGVQLITIGILGEYVGRIYEEMKQRPLYVIAEKLGLETENP